jgi:glycyl-tRNA synthetase beta chain
MSENYLLEIGTEEIPHEVLSDTLAQFRELSRQKLEDAGVAYAALTVWGTPRRIAVRLDQVETSTKEKVVEKKGPAVKAAYDAEGNPTRALLGFLQSNHLQPEQTEKRTLQGAEYVFVSLKEGGKSVDSVLPGIFQNVVASLSFPKTMKWSTGEFRFVRPIQWVVSMLGAKVLPVEIAGLTAGNVTRGHRQTGSSSIPLAEPSDYLASLEKQHVLADPEARKTKIRRLVDEKAAGLKAGAVLDDSLLDTLVNLTEDPWVAVASFEEDFLSIPKEVLISEMIEHQKYIPLVDKEGDLLSRFLVITNVPPTPMIVDGNERVVRARFRDGKFFFDEDRRRSLEDRLPELGNVLFAKGLGSVADKVARIEKLVALLAKPLGMEAALPNAFRAAKLCKCDLVTGMVGEFPELQGVIGYYYALASMENVNVAVTVKEHYWPKFSGDALPSLSEGILVSLADRLDNLLAMYSRGNWVTGSKDPYALRRQTLGVIRIQIEKKLHLDLGALVEQALPLYRANLSVNEKEYRSKLSEFITTRVRTVLKEFGFAHDEIDAGITGEVSDIYDAYLRIQSIHAARQTEGFKNLSVAFKRIKNILKGQKPGDLSEKLFSENAEKALHQAWKDSAPVFGKALGERDYAQCVSILTNFRAPVDRFFEDVLVMDKDEKVKGNRIALLDGIDRLFADFIDFEKIVTE